MAFPHVAGAGDCGCLWPWAPECSLCHCNSKCPLLRKNGSRSYDLFGKTRIYLGRRLGGASHFDVLSRELLPNILPVIVVTISTTAGWMILETAGLSFLGLGAQPPTADLGSMLGEGRKLLFTAPHVSTLPGLVILILVISLNLLGDGVRDVLDPRLRGGALRSPQPRTQVLSTEPSSGQVGLTGKLVVHNLTTELFQQGYAKPLVRNVDFELRPGECLGLVGESGCGKSVTALSLAALAASPPLQISSGTVKLDGRGYSASSSQTTPRYQRETSLLYFSGSSRNSKSSVDDW